MTSWALGLVRFWIPGLLRFWLLGSCAPGLLDSWAPGLLSSWAPGLLGSCAPGVLGFWAVGLLAEDKLGGIGDGSRPVGPPDPDQEPRAEVIFQRSLRFAFALCVENIYISLGIFS